MCRGFICGSCKNTDICIYKDYSAPIPIYKETKGKQHTVTHSPGKSCCIEISIPLFPFQRQM